MVKLYAIYLSPHYMINKLVKVNKYINFYNRYTVMETGYRNLVKQSVNCILKHHRKLKIHI